MRTERAERRRADRLPTRLRVDYCELAPTEEGVAVGGARRAIATDISAEGLALGGAVDLEVGSIIHLTLRLPDVPGNTVACDAKVVRLASDAQGVGCRFLRIQQWDSRRLAHFVERCTQAREAG